MARKKITPTSWFPIGIIFLCIAAVLCALTAAIILKYTPPEPLADATSLQRMTTGLPMPIPPEDSFATFHGATIDPPTHDELSMPTEVLGISAGFDTKRIEVDLTRQRVYAIENDRIVHEFIVSTGKWGWTPTGEFTIWTKVRSQLMKGGSRELGTYYYLPNVPYVMFFYNDEIAKMRGFSFHGTYWHDNFGQPMSHGCINMKTEDAKTLYEWATPVVTNAKAWSTPSTTENPGTKVIIYGKAPSN